MADVLDQIAKEVAACTRCPLHKGRCKTVPGEGSSNARLMFIGEAPGYHEDQQGRPFVGPSGDLLNKLINAIKMKREDVFIANVVKCRPPENRDPTQDEIAACKPFLDRQIAAINPRVIVTLGRFSMARWFPGDRISQIHGKTKVEGGRVIMPMFHPAAALRDGTRRTMMLFKEDGLTIPSLLERAEEIAATELWGMLDTTPAEPEPAPVIQPILRPQIAETSATYQPKVVETVATPEVAAEYVVPPIGDISETGIRQPDPEIEVENSIPQSVEPVAQSPVADEEQPAVVARKGRKPKAATNGTNGTPETAAEQPTVTENSPMLELLEVESTVSDETTKTATSGRKKKKEPAVAAEQLTLF